MARERVWYEGTVLLGVLLDRFGSGEQTITKSEAEKYLTSMPVEFTLVDDETVRIRIADDMRKES